MKIKLILLLALLFSLQQVQAQQYTSESKSAIKKFEKALMFFRNHQDEKALKELEGAIKKDSNFVEVYLLRSQIYHENNDREKELADLQKAVEVNPSFTPKTFFFLGETYFFKGEYELAYEAFKGYYDYGADQVNLIKSTYFLKCCEFAMEALENPVNFKPINLGTNVNTAYNDIMPAMTADESLLYFTVDLPISKKRPHGGSNRQEDFFVSKKIGGSWAASKNLGPPVNTKGNEGALSISADGQLLFFASSSIPGGYGSVDIYKSKRTATGWSEPENLGEVINTGNWETQPSISADGKTLYFISNRPGGQGSQDIWFSKQDDEGLWSKPENMGDKINTPQNENSPFFHHDSQTLYYASNGQIGFGGYDLYMTTIKNNGSCTAPKNLGYPINTHGNEEFLIVNARGTFAFMSSEREGSQKKDLFSFSIPEEIQPNPVTYVKGNVYDAETKEPLQANFTLIDLDTERKIAQSESSASDGSYLICLPSGKDYAFNSSKTNYLFYSENFSLKEAASIEKPYEMDIYLQPIKEGKIVVLNNVFFDTDKFQLKPESRTELDHLVRFLNQNSGIKIELGGHTDNIGSQAHNQTLSENRAKSVYQYLIDAGIDAKRLAYKGYGMSQPVVDNDTEENRAKNRRTEFKIIK